MPGELTQCGPHFRLPGICWLSSNWLWKEAEVFPGSICPRCFTHAISFKFQIIKCKWKCCVWLPGSRFEKEAMWFSSLFLLSFCLECGCDGWSSSSHLDHKKILRIKILHQDGEKNESLSRRWHWAHHSSLGCLPSDFLCVRDKFFLSFKNLSHSLVFFCYMQLNLVLTDMNANLFWQGKSFPTWNRSLTWISITCKYEYNVVIF